MHLIKRVTYYSLIKIISTIGQFIFLPIAVSKLGLNDYGIYVLMLQSALLIKLICVQPVIQVIIREYDTLKYKFSDGEISSLGLLFSLPIVIFGMGAIIVITKYTGVNFDFTHFQLLLIAAFTVVMIGNEIKQTISYVTNFKVYIRYELFSPLGAILCLIIISQISSSAENFIIISIIFNLLFGYVFFGYNKIFNPKNENIKIFWKSIKLYGIPLMIGEVFCWIISTSDRFQIAAQLDVSEAAKYAIGYQIFTMPLAILGFSTAIQSTVMAKSIAEYKRQMEGGSSVLLLISIVFFLGCMLFGKYILSILFNRNIDIDIGLITLLSLGGIAYAFYHMELLSAKYAKSTRLILIGQCFGGAFVLVGNYLLLPIIGIKAAALTTIAAYLAQIFIIRLFINKIYKYNIFNYRLLIEEILSKINEIKNKK